MSLIQRLPDHLINQIAAGEVVERPASVVKELLENALDADATHVTIEIQEGGDNFLRITDDGSGMDKEDAIMALERHATSKISSTDDLFNIHTLGFRGEAIASIASVSYLTIQTKKSGDLEGTLVMAEGGTVTNVKPVGVPEGTQIEVRQLFFNTPARKKYLKNPVTEYNHVFNMVESIALAFPNVAFRLVHDDKVVFDVPIQSGLWERIRSLKGKPVADELVPIFYGHSEVKLEGFIGKPLIARSNRNEQYLFVNNRAVKSHVLSYAVKDGYHTLLAKEKYPVFFLYFHLNPELIDVNVHPRKQEVRFRDEKEIFLVANQACRKGLETYVLSPNVDQIQPANYYHDRKPIPLVLSDRERQEGTFAGNRFTKPGEFQIQNALQFTENLAQSLQQSGGNPGVPFGSNSDAPAQQPSAAQPQTAVQEHFPFTKRETLEEMIPLAQLSNSFILCQQGKNLVMIDQHAAHERIRYTEILREFEERSVSIQPLLAPLHCEFSTKEIALIEESRELLEKMGFEIEAFGGNTFVVHAIPNYLTNEDLRQVFVGLLDDLHENARQGDFQKRKERSLIYMACRSAVKFGDPLSSLEQQSLVKKLATLDQPYTCPHGRPTMITMSFEELKKRFGREY